MKITDKYKVKPISSRDAKDWFLKKHYAKRVPQSSYLFGLFDGTLLVGVCSFGTPARMLNSIGDYKCYELNRLIINQGLKKNVLSYFLSKSISNVNKPTFLVSYADPNKGHNGYIYQATNWIYSGESSSENVFLKGGKPVHRRTVNSHLGTSSEKVALKNGYEIIKQKPKHRYFYIHASKTDRKKMMKAFPFEILPYPKGENTRYDASYKPSVQLRMDF